MNKVEGQNGEQEIIERVNQLEQKLIDFTNEIKSLREHPKIEYNVYVENIDVHTLTLDDLNFSIENIDVDELSGAMNIGNTFSPSVDQKQKNMQKEEKAKQEFINKISKIKKDTNTEKTPSEQGIKIFVNGKQVSHTVTDKE